MGVRAKERGEHYVTVIDAMNTILKLETSSQQYKTGFQMR